MTGSAVNGGHPDVEVAICGAGGHARVVADVLRSQWPKVVISGFLDDRADMRGSLVDGLPVLGTARDWVRSEQAGRSRVIVGIGDNRAREKVAELVDTAGVEFVSAVHRSVETGSDVSIGRGSVVMPNVVINAGSVIGDHVIVNTSASVDHDCRLGDISHISPGVHLAGGVSVGRGAHVGIGASVVPGVRIGEWATVGAGATVISDVPPHTTVVGTPAAPIKSRSAAN